MDDGSTDDALSNAVELGARILRVASRQGPAHGRNMGAQSTTGDVVLLLDADVCLGANTISGIRKRFEEDPELGAVFGSYDSEPSAPGLVSQFRNLLHFYVHQTSNHRASTFWAGCGAIRRRVFLKSGGFDVAYSTPCVEDLELGMRLTREGVRIALDPSIQVKHLKRWTLWGMIATDIWHRGVPWTRLILESHQMPNDLNLRLGARASVAMTALLCFQMALLAARGAHTPTLAQVLVFLAALASIVMLNLPFYRFLAARRQLWFAVLSVPLHLIHFLCCGTSVVFGVVIHYWTNLGVSLSRIKLRLPGQSQDAG